MFADRVYLYDSTLRDGTQTQGVDFSVARQAAIARALDGIGIDYVEGGWPGRSPTDTALFADPPALHRSRLPFALRGQDAENAGAGQPCAIGPARLHRRRA